MDLDYFLSELDDVLSAPQNLVVGCFVFGHTVLGKAEVLPSLGLVMPV